MTKVLPDHGIQTVVVNEKARIIDVVTVLHGDEHSFLLGSAGTASQLMSWLKKYIITDDVKLSDHGAQSECIELMGPRSAEVVQGLLSIDCGRWTLGQWSSVEMGETSVVVVRMPSTCELSYWLIGDTAAIEMIATSLRQHSDQVPELTVADATYLRVRSGMGAHDHEWSEAYNPLEAGLLHLTSFTKGCYIGQEVIARLDSYNKVKQRIMGIVSPAILHEGDVVLVDDKPVGVVTTVSPSCTGAQWFALGYVRGEHAVDSTSVAIESEGTRQNAMQFLPPLVDPSCP